MNVSLHVSRREMSVAQNKQSYRNIGYLFCSFFFSLFYFVLVVPGIFLGIGTLIIWIGVPILFVLSWLWLEFAVFERFLAMHWLGITIAPLKVDRPEIKGWWPIFLARLNNRMTWKTLAYMLLKFPLSTFCFGFTLAFPALGLGLMIAGGTLGLITAPFVALGLAIMNAPDPGARLWAYLRLSFAAFGLNLVYLSVLNGLAWIHAQLARSLLGMSDTSLRLEMARAQAEQEHARAEQSERRRRELVVNVSHELRAPVANISGHLESLLLATDDGTRTPEPAVLQNYLSIAYQEAQRLGQLVNELLSLARMETNELHLDIQEIAANEVVEEVYQMLMPLAQRDRQVTLVRGSQPYLPCVLADRQRLIQVLQNLVRNAIAYTPTGGIVSINLEAVDEQHVALIVEDNGIGIPSEELELIFERFYRADASRSRSTGGFGLGLAIVHDLVTAMGGSLKVESTVGQGSRFQVILRARPLRSYKSIFSHELHGNPL